jgi:1-phosphofructokinase family hexose kinase
VVLVVGQNSVWQKTYQLSDLTRSSVNRIDSVFESPAGKGSNTCRVLAGLGVEAELHAYVGGVNGTRFEEACAEDGFRMELTRIGSETRICTTLIEADTTMTELVEPAPEITAEEHQSFAGRFHKRIGAARLLVIAGTAVKGEPEESYEQYVRAGKVYGVATVLDSYRAHGKRALAASPEVLKINRDELAELSGMAVTDVGAREKACQEMLHKHGLRWIIITAGAEGAEGFSADATVTVRPPAVRSVNPIGSGDAVTAGVASVLERAGEQERELDWASAALLEQAVSEGVTMGTANCLNIRPGYVEQEEADRVRAHLTVTRTG